MKILLLTKSITTLGGVQRVVCTLCSSFAKEHDVTILSDDRVDKVSRYDVVNVKRVDINDVSKGFYNYSFLKKVIKKLNRSIGFLNFNILNKININLHYKKSNIVNLINYINVNEYDVVIGAQGDMAMYVALIKSSVTSKCIGWNHSPFDCYYNLRSRYYYGQSKIFMKYMRQLDELVVLSKYDYECFKTKWDIETNVITNIKSFTSEEKSDLSKKNFIAIGRFTYAKGFDILIEAFNLFYADNNSYRLTLIGDGEEIDEYNELIAKYNLGEQITIVNNVYDVKPYILNSCCLLMPSRWEGLGLVMLEAFEMGVPVIAFDLDTIKEHLINNYNGVKCGEINVDNFYNGMKRYLTLNKNMLQQNCIESSKLFSEDVILNKWENMINGIDKPF